MSRNANPRPLKQLDEWQNFIEDKVYPIPGEKQTLDYRNYDDSASNGVRDLYCLNHRYQTYKFVLSKEQEFLRCHRRRMSIFEAIDYLDLLVDESDPDMELSQLQHLLQTSEAIRSQGHEDWFVLVGLLRDIGKLLCLFGEPQWAVVGDTFPVGCRHSENIVYAEFFADNPDSHDERYNSKLGIYREGCGLKNVHLSWGHDEYMYQRMKEYLPEPALYMIRYHSFYAWHRENDYDYLCDDHDREMLLWVKKFNQFDLYTKCANPVPWTALRPYYEKLVDKYLPEKLLW